MDQVALPVTLQLRNCPASTVLLWIARLSGTHFSYRREGLGWDTPAHLTTPPVDHVSVRLSRVLHPELRSPPWTAADALLARQLLPMLLLTRVTAPGPWQATFVGNGEDGVLRFEVADYAPGSATDPVDEPLVQALRERGKHALADQRELLWRQACTVPRTFALTGNLLDVAAQFSHLTGMSTIVSPTLVDRPVPVHFTGSASALAVIHALATQAGAVAEAGTLGDGEAAEVGWYLHEPTRSAPGSIAADTSRRRRRVYDLRAQGLEAESTVIAARLTAWHGSAREPVRAWNGLLIVTDDLEGLATVEALLDELRPLTPVARRAHLAAFDGARARGALSPVPPVPPAVSTSGF